MSISDPNVIPESATAPPVAVRQKHPRGLYTLFFTEMWERFSYYGMRALLVLFMVDAVRGGMGLDDKTATAIYGLYTAAVYLMSLPGGWFADRLWGAQRAVWYGGIIIALGHFTLALPWVQTFYLGLVFVVVGSGTLKPNMSGLVGELYPEGGTRRDAGFTIFYMGVNLGAFLGPIVCGWLAKEMGWHWGFAAAGVGMVLGLIQFRASRHLLGDAGTRPGNENPLHISERLLLVGGMLACALVLVICLAGWLHFNPVVLAEDMTYVILAIAVAFFAYSFLFAHLDKVEKERVVMILVLFLASALFWAGFEQAGSFFNLFAQRFTERNWFHYELPAAWFQALGPIFIITFAPVFAWLWVWLARRNLDPSIPVKFALGLLMLAAGFAVMAGAAQVVIAGHKAWPTWLVMTYLLHTFGELCLSPVGLSSVTKLAPKKLAGQMMGIWFLATSLGNLLSGLLAGEFNPDEIHRWPRLFLYIILVAATVGLLLILLSRFIKRLMGGVK
ncbi:MAG TPA: peptide MFS transporter [Candidatus Polarisedimenticolia bacterium]|nr:peptide MFS transporter [Candidatus Polarisedimenticolia bacterium]